MACNKDELIDYATRSGAPLEVLENLQEIEDEGDVYESIEDIWPDYPSRMTSYGMTTNIKKSMIGLFSYQGAAFFIFLMSLFRLYLLIYNNPGDL